MFDAATGAAVVLELNANPSLDITGPDGKTVCATDRHVKVPMLRDALRIAVLQQEGTTSDLEQAPASKIQLKRPSNPSPLCWEQLHCCALV